MRRLVISIVLLFGLTAPVLADGPADEKPTRREHEILRERPSGFWTSNKPAEGGSYRWRLLGIGVGLLVITAFSMVVLIKRANAERATRATKPDDSEPSDTPEPVGDAPDDAKDEKPDSGDDSSKR